MGVTYKRHYVDLLDTYTNSNDMFYNVLSINNLDNFLLCKNSHGRFRADDSLCEFLKKAFRKSLI